MSQMRIGVSYSAEQLAQMIDTDPHEIGGVLQTAIHHGCVKSERVNLRGSKRVVYTLLQQMLASAPPEISVDPRAVWIVVGADICWPPGPALDLSQPINLQAAYA